MTGKAGPKEEEQSTPGMKAQMDGLGEEQEGESTVCHGGGVGGQRVCFVFFWSHYLATENEVGDDLDVIS